MFVLIALGFTFFVVAVVLWVAFALLGGLFLLITKSVKE